MPGPANFAFKAALIKNFPVPDLMATYGFYPRIVAKRLLQLRPHHWVLTIRDFSPLDEEGQNDKNFILKSEMMGIFAIFFRQMYQVDWDSSVHKYKKRILIYKAVH